MITPIIVDKKTILAQEQMNILLGTSNIGTWRITNEDKLFYFDKKYAELHEIHMPSPLPFKKIVDHWIALFKTDNPTRLYTYLSMEDFSGMFPYEKNYTKSDGRKVYLKNTYQTLYDETGKAVETIGMVMDVTHNVMSLKEHAERQRLIVQISQAFIAMGDFDWQMRSALRIMGESFRCSTVILGVRDEKGEVFVPKYMWNADGREIPLDEEKAQVLRQDAKLYDNFVVKRRSFLKIDSFAPDDPQTPDIDIIKSALIFPIIINDTVVGVLQFGQDFAPYYWSENEIQTANLLSGLLSASIERHNSERSLADVAWDAVEAQRKIQQFEAAKVVIEERDRELQKAYDVMGAMLDGVDCMIYVTDIETDDLIMVNKHLDGLFQINGEINGRRCWEIFRPGATQRCSFCPKLKLDENPNEVMEWIEYEPRSKSYIRHHDKYIDWPNGKKVHIQSAFDITDIKRAEKELEEQLRQQALLNENLVKAKMEAENANKAKSMFLSNMSHEIRTPMNAIMGMTQIVRGANNEQKRSVCLDKIEESSKQLLAIVNDILDISKIGSGKFDLEMVEFCPAQMLTTTCALIMDKLNEKNILLTTSFDDALHGVYLADEARITQVLTNLLSNAMKFTPPNGRIFVEARELARSECNSTIRFSIRDTGIGISEEQLARIFKAFEQADGSVTRKYGGAGLGLAISKSLVEKMDGDLEVKSQVGSGSEFSFTLSLERVDAAASVSAPGGYAAEQRGETADQVKALAEETLDFSNLSLLLVEDIAINREMFIALLEDTGIRIDTAQDGVIAIKKYKENPDQYNIIVTDIQMPNMNGFDVAIAVRAMNFPNSKTIPIIAMTANVFQDDIDKCFEAGMNDHLEKPIDADILIERLARYARSSK